MVDLDPHQLEAIDKLSTGKILCGGVGSGKTRTALAYYVIRECSGGVPINGEGHFHPPMHPRELYVFTTATKRDSLDWEEEALSFGIVRDGNPSRWGMTIVVDSWNNIGKYEDLEQAFVIFDEQRVIGTGAWVKSFYKIAANNEWILLSATPGDVWLDYAPVFIANGYYKNITDFREQHVIYKNYRNYPQVDRYIGTKKLERIRDEVLIPMPVMRHTTRNIVELHVDYDREEWKWLLKNRFSKTKNRPFKNAAELYWNLRKLVNSHWTRCSQIVSLQKQHPRLIVWYNYDYELELLRDMCVARGITYAELNGHKHEPAPETDEWFYLVQYTAGKEAWNCIVTNAMVFYSQNYSYKVQEQCMGRIDRLNTPHEQLYYYVLRSNSPIDLAIAKAVRMKKKFNESAFTRSLDK